MLDIFVRIKNVDMDGYNGRDHHPTKDMEGSYVRVTNLETVPEGTANEECEGDPPYQIFFGIIVDANGDDVEGGEVELIDHELDSYCNMPQLFGCKKGRNA